MSNGQSCWLCPFFGSSDRLTKHLLKRHKDHPSLIYTCKLCRTRFSNHKQFKNHCRTYHRSLSELDLTPSHDIVDNATPRNSSSEVMECDPSPHVIACPVETLPMALILPQAALLLRLKTIHKLSDAGLEDRY